MANQISQQVEPTFGAKRFQQTLKSHKEVLDKYYAGFDEAKELKGNEKIFLDTNVLLRIYSTSFAAREKLLQFFKDYKDRIVLAGQVQWEFIKNRENVIAAFSKDVTQKIPDTFNETIISSIDTFLASNKTILTDYPDVIIEVEKLKQIAEKVLEKIKKDVQNKRVSKNNILYNDVFLAEFEKLELLSSLTVEHLDVIKKDYDTFIKGIDKSQTDKETFKTFPGCFEKSDKADDPYGDFVIYHEMLKYAKNKQVDVIFLTYDITKGDWMQKNKEPHLHYAENFYLNTSRMLYILDGKRTFDEVLQIDSKSLIVNERKMDGEVINIDTLQSLLDSFPPFQHLKPDTVSDEEPAELKYNGYKTITEILVALNATISAISYLQKKYPHFNRIGMLRGCLAFYNPQYKIVGDDGTTMKFMNDENNKVFLNWLASPSNTKIQ